ncbi:hypothetical protein THAOC_05219 [Thalassiosira oceanica]|uniref:Reverse transcriptase Ty1/copia-type domain-containing protein n=1 Tax=Thalassiosira oceanica TaxID=159749 RepID=K0TN35_THAOC|nr:hypothetical protein THAOC_05219 [Thalassiosira oceanica]|eukprot:EJK73172.1 hypothetical protein THAOC_05219 [Thalassiosira oceanica]
MCCVGRLVRVACVDEAFRGPAESTLTVCPAAGRDYWLFLRKFMHEKLGFRSSRGDPDVWFRESKRKSDGSLLRVYTDDILVLSNNAESILLRNEIGGDGGFELKPGSFGPPSQYLGGKMSEVTLQNGQKAWSFSSGQYVSKAVANVKKYLQTINRVLPRRAETPMAANYRPEVDISTTLDWSLDGPAFAWKSPCCRLILLYLVKGTLIRSSTSSRTLENTTMPRWCLIRPSGTSPRTTPDARLELLYLWLNMRILVFVDSDHAGDEVTRRSGTRFIVFLNKAKKQTSCETSTYGSEFIAMKSACEYVRGLRYKLRMMGLRVDEPAYIYGDNKSVLANSGNPGATLKKKTSAIAYHFVREGCVSDEWRTTGYANTQTMWQTYWLRLHVHCHSFQLLGSG